MKFSPAHYLLSLLPALVLSTRQDYEDLEQQLKEVFRERSTILYQLTKTSRELDGIKSNLRSLKNEEKAAKTNVEKLLEIGEKQREQMKSLQVAMDNQIKETSQKVEKQLATINFLKTEMERKTKMIRDLQNENKSLKNKLLSGNKLCGLHAEESKKIQAQLKELRYGKKDLLFKAQQLTELEQKLAVAKNELEKAAFDKDSQMKAMKETVRLCLSTVFRDKPSPLSLSKSNPTQESVSFRKTQSTLRNTTYQPQQKLPESNAHSGNGTPVPQSSNPTLCGPEDKDEDCLLKKENSPINSTRTSESALQKLQIPSCTECKLDNKQKKQMANFEGKATREEKIL